MSFRPLTGKLVLIANGFCTFRKLLFKFPSPYGEVGFDPMTSKDEYKPAR